MKKKYSALSTIQKRDGTIVPFDEKRITRAITSAMQSVQEGTEIDARAVMTHVLDALLAFKKEIGRAHV